MIHLSDSISDLASQIRMLQREISDLRAALARKYGLKKGRRVSSSANKTFTAAAARCHPRRVETWHLRSHVHVLQQRKDLQRRRPQNQWFPVVCRRLATLAELCEGLDVSKSIEEKRRDHFS